MKGLIKEGGSMRRDTAVKLVESVGGKLECFYFAFGEEDLVVIFDAPDNVSAAALSLKINASGAAQGKVTVLLTPEEIDQATQKSVSYRPPGQ